MEAVAIVANLEGKCYSKVIKLQNRLKRYKPNNRYKHPHLTFQGGHTENIENLKKSLPSLISNIKSFEIKTLEMGHFTTKTIFLRAEKTTQLIKISKIVNKFLRNHCKKVDKFYVTKRWTPHVTLATNLKENNFKNGWKDIRNKHVHLTNKIHNICLVKRYENGNWRIIREFRLK